MFWKKTCVCSENIKTSTHTCSCLFCFVVHGKTGFVMVVQSVAFHFFHLFQIGVLPCLCLSFLFGNCIHFIVMLVVCLIMFRCISKSFQYLFSMKLFMFCLKHISSKTIISSIMPSKKRRSIRSGLVGVHFPRREALVHCHVGGGGEGGKFSHWNCAKTGGRSICVLVWRDGFAKQACFLV